MKKVVYTDGALESLAEILAYIAAHYPTAYDPFQRRLQSVLTRVSQWPDSAQEVAGRPDIRVVPLIRYPYRVFYRSVGETVEILHIHHATRDEPPDI